MKAFILLISFAFWASNVFGQSKKVLDKTPNPGKEILKVEVACGQCQLGLEGQDCDLAIRFNGRYFFVKGTHIDDHGDAHDVDGFCQTIRKAEVQGELIDDKFDVSYFQLVEKTNQVKPK